MLAETAASIRIVEAVEVGRDCRRQEHCLRLGKAFGLPKLRLAQSSAAEALGFGEAQLRSSKYIFILRIHLNANGTVPV